MLCTQLYGDTATTASGVDNFLKILNAFTPLVKTTADTAASIINTKNAASAGLSYTSTGAVVPSYLQNTGSQIQIPAVQVAPTDYTPFLIAGGLGLAGIVVVGAMLRRGK